ncbi:NAD-dependent malic enzyme [Zhongshania sp. BJYM1]|uniref:NAD-dependent malic enzyme n=1 Tax=Zhongshania aquatica TaxID=2965069 RepID=UPI0022B48BC5|nr:NAD-dependent malic enzyme [Marortus sp. BJYM1]
MTDHDFLQPLYIPYAGPALLETPLLNKSSAFSEQERRDFNLAGLLPPRYETIDEQVDRAYLQYSSFEEPMNKHIYLRAIQDNNETLFYRLVKQYIVEMMPIIYTPTVGDACEQFSDIYRSSRGLIITYDNINQIDDILRNATKRKVKVIVVTDGERVLGLGDQGIGGMGIPIGKLSLYTACGGISPAYTLPVMLDVGTNNKKLLEDKKYMGARHPRIHQSKYNEFVDSFMQSAQRRWPGVLIQFEDFAQHNAMQILQRYRHSMCCFNDDIQGTAAVTLGSLLAACRHKGVSLSSQKIVFVGAGSAGCGIAEQLIRQMIKEGLSDQQARQQIYMVDRFGLITENSTGLRDFQLKLIQHSDNLATWDIRSDFPSLLEVVEQSQAGILIGVSGVAGVFTEQVIKTLSRNTQLPIIFPLSNPSRQVEARPEDIIEWCEGKVIIATGSPFNPVEYGGRVFDIPQCNNSYIFPGVGLGVLACKARLVSDEMLMAASNALATVSPLVNDGEGKLLPPLTEITELSREIAFVVAKVAIDQGLAQPLSDEQLLDCIERNFWTPRYRPYKRVSL